MMSYERLQYICVCVKIDMYLMIILQEINQKEKKKRKGFQKEGCYKQNRTIGSQ